MPKTLPLYYNLDPNLARLPTRVSFNCIGLGYYDSNNLPQAAACTLFFSGGGGQIKFIKEDKINEIMTTRFIRYDHPGWL